jgi:DNA-binding NtrC family response regulator
MYRILYHGPDTITYARLREDFPGDMRLVIEHNLDRLKENLSSAGTHGIILPLSDPGPDEYQYLRKVIRLPSSPGVIVAANPISAAQAVCCVRHGAFDCLAGPVNGTIMGACLNRMISRAEVKAFDDPVLIAGGSQLILSLLSRLADYADLPHPVLITGETGTGKELAAQTIHRRSSRRDGPFVAVNCAAYPDELLGSEMFGSRKGAFTGSVDRPGLIEGADGGTLFLDEIGDMSMQGQACLLRVIEEGTLRRMGSNLTRRIDVRVIAATNINLQDAIRSRSFRADLYYRLNLLGVTMPPLRKHREDIPALVRNYLETIVPGITWRVDSAAMASLLRYSWPGNVRELQSVILKATLSARNSIILPKDLRFG